MGSGLHPGLQPLVPVPAEGLPIGQAAKVCGLSIDTLRYYERAGLTLSPTPRAGSGQRRYRERDLRWLISLVMLRETGMSIAEMREVTALARRQGAERDLLAVFEQHRDRLVQRIGNERRHLRAIETKIAYYRNAVERPAPTALKRAGSGQSA
jgi:DNA-binding transcriptional MerR regulator